MNPISTFCGILSLVAIITQKWIIILLREKLEKCIRAPVAFEKNEIFFRVFWNRFASKTRSSMLL